MASTYRGLIFWGTVGFLALFVFSGCSKNLAQQNTLPVITPALPEPLPPQAQEATPKPESKKIEQMGTASFYGSQFHGQETASGETFDQNQLTAAHRTLPLGSKAVVTNLDTGKSVQVTINDRGPYVKGRKIDLSRAAAQKIGLTKKEGITKVKIEATSTRKAKVKKRNRRVAKKSVEPIPQP